MIASEKDGIDPALICVHGCGLAQSGAAVEECRFLLRALAAGSDHWASEKPDPISTQQRVCHLQMYSAVDLELIDKFTACNDHNRPKVRHIHGQF